MSRRDAHVRQLEEEAADGERRAKTLGVALGAALGFCPNEECSAELYRGCPHVEGCPLTAHPSYQPRGAK